MIQAMQGILANEPAVKEVTGRDGRQFVFAKADLLYWDGRESSEDCTVQVMAWNEQALHLAKYHAGEEVQFIGRLNAAISMDSYLTELSFTIQRIDDSKTIVAATEQFLRDFTPLKQKLSEQIRQAEERNEATQTQGPETQQPFTIND